MDLAWLGSRHGDMGHWFTSEGRGPSLCRGTPHEVGVVARFWWLKLAAGEQARLGSFTQCISLLLSTFSETVITLDFKQLPLISGPAQVVIRF